MVKSRDVGRGGMHSRTLTAVLSVLLLFLNARVAVAMQVTSTGPQTIQVAQGEKATLECMFTAGPTDIGELDIEWSLVSPDMTQKDTLILSFAGGRKWIHGDSALMKGLDFRAADPSQGDASISISAVDESQTSTYQCKVKRAPGVDMRKVTLVVMVRPSVPTCWAEGSQTIGGALSLHCKSTQGSAPMQYIWVKEGTAGIHPSITQDSISGELRIGNHTEAFAGMYRCEASNAVGKQRCTYTLRAESPPSRAGVIAGTVIGVLLLVIIILLLICLLICRYGRRWKDKDAANDIREDSPPPVSRAHSRISAFRQGVAYSAVGTEQPWGDSEFSSDLTDSSKALKPLSFIDTSDAGRSYDSRYGHPV